MRPISRRDFLLGAAVLGLAGASAFAQTGDKFDLVIKGGEVLDPSQRLRARSDLGIRNAMIAALEPDIPDLRAKQQLDASGKLVLPGLGRHARARLSGRLGARPAGGRTSALYSDHDLRERG